MLALPLAACTSQQTRVEPDQAGAVSASVEEGQVWHFGYGSNLSSDFLLQYCPNLEFVMRADLPNYEVQFRYYSENRQGGISSIIEAPGEVTRGVIYSMPTAEMDALDIITAKGACPPTHESHNYRMAAYRRNENRISGGHRNCFYYTVRDRVDRRPES